MPKNEISQRAAQRAAANADQVEFAALLKGDAPISEGIRDDKIADSLPDNYGIVGDLLTPIENRDVQLDSADSETASELRRRALLLGDAYPFEIIQGSVRYRGSNTRVYEFCLAITQVMDLKPKPYCHLPRAFERLTAHVLKAWLGRDAEFYRTGAPADGDHATTFEETLKELQRRCGEWEWRPRDPRYEDPRSVRDGGVDFVVWKRLPDGRIGSLFVLGQSACGNDWPNKLGELNPELIKGKYSKGSAARELRCFATPFHIPHSKIWDDASLAGGIVFDRVRITWIAENYVADVLPLARVSYDQLIRIVLPEFEAA